ncbi:hypothetical protein HD554DRAFT_1164084 [Boletus coccyginus]|nr:hypothetical protein HD554DRAFT_1164084 [Boletus coccyginus]
MGSHAFSARRTRTPVYCQKYTTYLLCIRPRFTMYITPDTRLYPAPYPSASPPAIHLLTSSTRPALIKSPISMHSIRQPPPIASCSALFIMSSFSCMIITSFLAYRYYHGHPVGVTSHDSERSPQIRDHTPAANPTDIRRAYTPSHPESHPIQSRFAKPGCPVLWYYTNTTTGPSNDSTRRFDPPFPPGAPPDNGIVDGLPHRPVWSPDERPSLGHGIWLYRCRITDERYKYKQYAHPSARLRRRG